MHLRLQVVIRCLTSQLVGPALLLFLVVACVGDPPKMLDPGWVQIQPGVGQTVVFSDEAGLLNGVFLQVPPEAVSTPIAIRLSVAMATAPVFLQTGGGAAQHTPAIKIEPFNHLFNVPVALTLPWHELAVSVAVEDVRAWSSDGSEGVPLGLWEPVTVFTVNLPSNVTLALTRGGFYWAGQWSDDPFGEAQADVGSPCLAADSRLEACTSNQTCMRSGCMGEVCGQAPVLSACLPSELVMAKLACRCRCAASRCQWVQ